MIIDFKILSLMVLLFFECHGGAERPLLGVIQFSYAPDQVEKMITFKPAGGEALSNNYNLGRAEDIDRLSDLLRKRFGSDFEKHKLTAALKNAIDLASYLKPYPLVQIYNSEDGLIFEPGAIAPEGWRCFGLLLVRDVNVYDFFMGETVSRSVTYESLKRSQKIASLLKEFSRETFDMVNANILKQFEQLSHKKGYGPAIFLCGFNNPPGSNQLEVRLFPAIVPLREISQLQFEGGLIQDLNVTREISSPSSSTPPPIIHSAIRSSRKIRAARTTHRSVAGQRGGRRRRALAKNKRAGTD